MSKGSSGLFTGTSGEGRDLIAEVIKNGEKISPDDVLLIAKDPNGKIVWIEKGNSSAGLQHIVDQHGSEFNGKGISNDDIPAYVMSAVTQGKVVGSQGKRNPRTIYEFEYNGKKQRVAVQVSENGFIVSANPKKTEDSK